MVTSCRSSPPSAMWTSCSEAASTDEISLSCPFTCTHTQAHTHTHTHTNPPILLWYVCFIASGYFVLTCCVDCMGTHHRHKIHQQTSKGHSAASTREHTQYHRLLRPSPLLPSLLTSPPPPLPSPLFLFTAHTDTH